MTHLQQEKERSLLTNERLSTQGLRKLEIWLGTAGLESEHDAVDVLALHNSRRERREEISKLNEGEIEKEEGSSESSRMIEEYEHTICAEAADGKKFEGLYKRMIKKYGRQLEKQEEEEEFKRDILNVLQQWEASEAEAN